MRTMPVNSSRVKGLRIAKGLQQAELADQADCSVKTVNSLENGGRAYLATIRSVATALGVNVKELLPSGFVEGDHANQDGEVRPLAVVEPTHAMDLILDRDWDSYSDEDQECLAVALASLLKVGEVRIRRKRRGSVILTLDMTTEQILRLGQAIEAGELEEHGVVALRTAAPILTGSSSPLAEAGAPSSAESQGKILARSSAAFAPEPRPEESFEQLTSLVLLEQPSRPDPEPHAWQRFIEIYMPFIRYSTSRMVSGQEDADDLAQEVMTTIFRELPAFNPEDSFRKWLRRIISNRARAFHRRKQPAARTGQEAEQLLNQLEDPSSDLAREWDREHDHFVLTELMVKVQPDFDPTCWQAFKRSAVDGRPAAEVARELDISVNAVILSKWRVLKRFREEAEGLLK